MPATAYAPRPESIYQESRALPISKFSRLLLIFPLAAATLLAQTNNEALQYFTEMVKIDTSFPPGNETKLAKYLADILQKEGIPSQLSGENPDRLSLIARLKGTGAKKPILIMGHTDVVPVQKDRWTEDPFGAKIVDGYMWGRGTSDDKSIVTGALMTMLRLKRSGVALDRDVIFVAESGEEGGGAACRRYCSLTQGVFVDALGGRAARPPDKHFNRRHCARAPSRLRTICIIF